MTSRSDAYDLYKGDWECIDGIETVTLTDLDSNSIASVKAKRRNLSYPELSSGQSIGVEPGDEVWSIWDDTITGDVVPQSNFKLTDSNSVVYTLTSATSQKFGTIWRCTAKKDVV